MLSGRTAGLVLAVACVVPLGADTQPHKFDAGRLRTGCFTYRDTERDKEMGKSRITIEEISESGHYRFSNTVTGNFSQRWSAIATSSLSPISANLSFGESSASPVFDLSYSSGRVTGYVIERKGPAAGTRRRIDDSVPSTIVDQRIDWAAASASDFESNPSFEFDVYDPATGISHVSARKGDLQSIRVPAGEFDVYPITYEIRKRSGSETYKVFVTKEEPRMLIREDFPNAAQSDLIGIAPSYHRGNPRGALSPSVLSNAR